MNSAESNDELSTLLSLLSSATLTRRLLYSFKRCTCKFCGKTNCGFPQMHIRFYCLSDRKFERLGGPLDEIVTVFVHKYSVITPHLNI